MTGEGEGDGGVPQGRLLARFADAVVVGSDQELAAVRDQLSVALGSEALVDAAGIVAIFSCNVRVADASGIPLDESTAEARERIGKRVGIARYQELDAGDGSAA